MIIESHFLNDRQVEDLQMIAEIVNAMAISDGFPDVEACSRKYPQRLSAYRRYAGVALQAVRRVQGYSIQLQVDGPEEVT